MKSQSCKNSRYCGQLMLRLSKLTSRRKVLVIPHPAWDTRFSRLGLGDAAEKPLLLSPTPALNVELKSQGSYLNWTVCWHWETKLSSYTWRCRRNCDKAALQFVPATHKDLLLGGRGIILLHSSFFTIMQEQTQNFNPPCVKRRNNFLAVA